MSVETFVRFQTPSQMAPEALEAIFVQREELARRLVDKIVESATTKSKHHALLIGPRGIGKTHLVSLVHNRVSAREDLKEKLAIAWLREEAYSVASYVHLLLAILKGIAEPSDGLDLDDVIDKLQSKDDAEQERFGEATLLRAIGDRTLLVITENLDDTFEAIETDGQHKLRALIQNHPRFTILATSQSLFGGVSLRESPFYGFFEVHRLDRLSFEEALEMLVKISELRGDSELREGLRTPLGRARVRAIDHLAAGSPRIYVILSEFLGTESIDELVEPVLKMIENLTPYYQSRMQLITPQQRAIVEFLCERDDASPVKTIARGVLISQQTASGQLKKLKELGYVRSIKSGREAHYELQEPLMRMALSSKNLKGMPLGLFVEFLRLWYTERELGARITQTLEGAVAGLDCQYVTTALELCRSAASDPRLDASSQDYSRYIAEQDYRRALAAAEEMVELRGGPADWSARAGAELGVEDYAAAVKSFTKVVELDPGSARSWAGLGFTLNYLGGHDEALSALDKSLALDSTIAMTWAVRGSSLMSLARYKDALASFDKAIELEPNFDWSVAWGGRALALWLFRRHQEALECADRATRLAPDNAGIWCVRGLALIDLERSGDALASLETALSLDPRLGEAWFNQASALVNLGRLEEALASLDEAIKLGHPRIHGRIRGTFLRVALGRTREAEGVVADLMRSQFSDALPASLIEGIEDIAPDSFSERARLEWLRIWKEAAGDRDDYRVALRMLEKAVLYLNTGDRAALLALPAEERSIVAPLVGWTESDDDGQ